MNNTNLSWGKGWSLTTYRIFDNDKQIGFIKNPFFWQDSIAEINGKKYEFRDKGFFNQNTEIIDIAENSIVGEIKYSLWGNKATIEMSNEIFTWAYTNGWNTKWEFHDSKGLNILYKASAFSDNGQIETNGSDDLKLLTGLYIHSHRSRIALVALIPILAPVIIRFLLH